MNPLRRFFMDKNNSRRNYTSKLTTTALLVALAIILDQIKLFEMPQGGAVTLFGTLPIIALGYLLGTRWGLLGGAVTGLLNLIFGGYVIHPVQMILDYVIAFAVMGLAVEGVMTGIVINIPAVKKMFERFRAQLAN